MIQSSMTGVARQAYLCIGNWCTYYSQSPGMHTPRVAMMIPVSVLQTQYAAIAAQCDISMCRSHTQAVLPDQKVHKKYLKTSCLQFFFDIIQILKQYLKI